MKKKSKSKKSYKQTNLLYNKKDWKIWVIVYGGIALIFYGTLYLFTLAK